MLTPKQFWLKAAQFGSMNTAADPGACLYGFDEHGLVQSERHRRDCIGYLETIRDRTTSPGNAAAAGDIDALLEYLRSAPVKTEDSAVLDTFTAAYVEAALWLTIIDLHDESCRDNGYAAEHMAPETLERIRADCALFQERYGDLLTDDNLVDTGDVDVESRAGHDFWLTRNGHGAGFWDGRWRGPVGDVLDKASKAFGEIDLYVGDDHKLHLSGGDPQPSLPSVPAELQPTPTP